MANIYNIYCDESCHLENDGQKIMVFGAVCCPLDEVKEISVRLREIKLRNFHNKSCEVKWSKISPGNSLKYIDLLDYFFDDDHLDFRAVIADKTNLDHRRFNQDHDTWYYKMYYVLLRAIFDPKSHYRIYIDIKDTRSANKVKKLHNVLCNSKLDFSNEIIERVQTIRSHESELIQLSDLLTGAISYINRGLKGNNGKLSFIERLQKRSQKALTITTLQKEKKVNILKWSGR